jgi:hypothetical protein
MSMSSNLSFMFGDPALCELEEVDAESELASFPLLFDWFCWFSRSVLRNLARRF